MTKTKKKYVAKSISAKRLAAMTRPEKRVLIAKDVLERLDGGLLNARTGNYVLAKVSKKLDSEEDASKVLANKKCEVCAIGAAFVSAVCRFDKLPIGPLLESWDGSSWVDADRRDATVYLGDFFSQKQLDLMENAFEGGYNAQARVFFDTYRESDSKRLRAIMENIVAHKGTFKPGKDERVRDRFEGNS